MNNLGYIISIEGIDFCGKSTHRKLIENYFKEKNINYISCHALEGTELSCRLKKILLESEDILPLSELFLFEAARHQIVKEIIEPAIMQKKVVLLDRYMDSSVVYQGYLQGVNLELIDNLNKAAVSGFEPDLTLLLDIKKETFIERLKNCENLDVIENKLINNYDRLNLGFSNLTKNNNRIKLIDAEKSIDEVHGDIIKQINILLDI